MASQFLLVTVVLAFCICCQCEADLISKVCSSVLRNPSLCDQVLRSHPNSKGSDLAGLGEIVVEKGRDAVKAALSAVKSVPPKGRVKGIIDTCVELFTDAVDYLNDCKQNLKSHDWDSLKRNASGALGGVGTCDDEFTDDGGVEPPEVAQADRRAQDIIEVLLVIATLS